MTYFIRHPANAVLNRLIDPYRTRPVGRPPTSGIQIRLVDLCYQAQTSDRERRVVAKIEWHAGELFPRIGFIVTNSKLPAGKVVKMYNGRGDVENHIKEGKNTLRWDKTSCHRFAANEARLLMGVLAYKLLQLLRQFYLMGEEVKWSMEWLIKRLIKVGGGMFMLPQRSLWPITIGPCLGEGTYSKLSIDRRAEGVVCSNVRK